MTDKIPTKPRFQEEPPVTPPPFGDRLAGRILLMMLKVALLVALLGGLSWVMARLRTPSPPEGAIVVASHDLKPYQRLGVEDIELGQVHNAVTGTVLTDTAPLLNQAVLLDVIDKGAAVTTESVITFPTTVKLTDTVILNIPLPPEKATIPALEPGLSVLIIGATISDTVTTPTYSTTVPLVDVTHAEAIVAVQPEVAARLSFYLSPWGQLTLTPTIDR